MDCSTIGGLKKKGPKQKHFCMDSKGLDFVLVKDFIHGPSFSKKKNA
jgi:hypothetical protein